MDGEALYTDHVTMRMVPRAMNLIVPRGVRFFDGSNQAQAVASSAI